MSEHKPTVRTRTRPVAPATPQPAIPTPQAAASATQAVPLGDPPARGKGKQPRQKKQPTGDYPVGYCKTPVSTRFPNEHSNKKGRPRGSKNLATRICEELGSNITIVEGGVEQIMTRRDLVAKRVVVAAIKVDGKALDIAIKADGGYGDSKTATSSSSSSQAQPTEPRTELRPDEEAVWDEFMAMAREAAAIEAAAQDKSAASRKRGAKR